MLRSCQCSSITIHSSSFSVFLAISLMAQTLSAETGSFPSLAIRLDAQAQPLLTWGNLPNLSLALEWNSNLDSGNWALVPANDFTLTTSGSENQARILPGDFPTRFFRLRGESSSLGTNVRAYAVGNPTLVDLWVDSVNGSDENDGATHARAFRTLLAAWRSIPEGRLETNGYRIRLVRGNYAGAYLEDRRGTSQFPILIEPADGPGTVNFQPIPPDGGDLTVFGSSYVYLQDFRIEVEGGDALHFELCDHVLVRRMTISSRRTEGQDEALKVNQSQHIYIEDSDIANAGDNAIDMVAVQYGHVVRNRIHNARDWGIYLKGGSAYFVVEGNEIYDCGTGGFTAGQGTGFQFMVAPWLYYEAYDVKIVNNVIHDTEGAGLGVNGGYNILMAFNTLYRVGSRSHGMELVYGRRGCDGNDVARCQPLLDAGGWGLTGEEEPFIPNRNIFVYNNLLYNPPGFQSAWQHFQIAGATIPPPASNVPSPSRADDNLQIRGNIFWNGPSDLILGVEEPEQGCQDSNPTCFASQLRADNAINQFEPQLVNPAGGDFHPVAGGNVSAARTFPLPDFDWSDAPARPPVPSGELRNVVTTDRSGRPRQNNSLPGAYLP